MSERFFQPCPCCGSNQVQLCIDANNAMKDRAKCRECGVTGLLFAWNRRPDPRAMGASAVTDEQILDQARPWLGSLTDDLRLNLLEFARALLAAEQPSEDKLHFGSSEQEEIALLRKDLQHLYERNDELSHELVTTRPTPQPSSSERAALSEALGLPSNGIREGKRVGFSWDFLIGMVRDMVAYYERHEDFEPQPSEDKRTEAVCIEELFERQAAGFARAFEALGIDADDDRERSWSSLVLAIDAAIAKGE